MASTKDDVFLKVEAVLSLDWIKTSGKELTTMLEEIENLGIDSIGFSRGNHVLVGSMDQLVRIREHFLGNTKHHSPSGKATAVHTEPFGGYNHPERRSERKRNDLPKKFPLFADPEREEADVTDAAPRAVKSNRDRPRVGIAPPSKPNNQVISKELMVDNDIWEYMESKKRDELNDLETMFGAALTKAEDDSGVLKIAISPKSGDTTSDEVVIMHETLVGLYQETFMKCVIEKHEVHVSDEEAELMLDYISDRFPMVFAKRCIYNDDFLFIGPPRMAREARQQFQVLAQRLRKGELKAKVDDRDNYAEYPGRERGYGRCGRRADDMYGELPYDYTNEFQNALNEDVIHVENRPKRRESFTEDEGRGMSPGDDVVEPLNNECLIEEDEPRVEEKKPRLNLTPKDFEAPAADWNRREKNRHGKLTDDAKQQSGASSLVYWRQDNEDSFEDTKRCSSDVEDDDRKQEFTARNVEIKKGRKGDEFQHEIADRKFRKSPKTDDTPDFTQVSQNESKSTASSLCDDDIYNDDENKTGSAKAAKPLDDVSHRNKWQTEEDDRVSKKVSPTARIDANSITHRSADLDFSEPQAEVTTKIFDEFINNDADEKLILSERSEKKPRKKTYDSGPKVKIIKQAFPIVTESGDIAQTEVGIEFKVVDEPKVTSEKSNVHVAADGATAGAAVKLSHGEILGAPSRVPGYLEELELREVFRAQKKTLKKMPFDSASSDDDSDDAADRATLRRGRMENKDELTQERIEELMACGDEASQKLLQSLLEKATNDAGGKVADVVDKGKVESDVVVVDGAAHGGARPKVEAVPAVQKQAATGRQRKPKNNPTVPQPPDGNIGCVIDKAFHLEGHDKSGTIEINISFEDGNQADDQLEPGRPYRAMTMKAFLPASGDGRETLRLMKAAFAARKLFALEGKVDDDEDVIVPNGVNFKDNIDLYPDPGYLPKVMEQLRLLTEDQDK